MASVAPAGLLQLIAQSHYNRHKGYDSVSEKIPKEPLAKDMSKARAIADGSIERAESAPLAPIQT